MILILINEPFVALPPLAVSLVITTLLQPVAPDSTTVARESYLMGTTLRVSVASVDRLAGIAAIESAFDAVRRVDALLSTWRDDSEIARLNRAPTGAAVTLSPELLALLREAARWSAATGGAFDPAIGALVDAWDLRGPGRLPSAERLASARAATGLDRFTLGDSGNRAARHDPAAWLDTGGFGKGVALREAGRVLRAAGIRSALLNFGGQVLVLGRERGQDRIIPVAHPSRRGEAFLRLRVPEGSASTSSQSEQTRLVDGVRVSHLLDPRTGKPIPAWGSVTVVAEDPAVADMMSTALFVLGPDAGARWAAARTDVGVLFLVEREGRVVPTWNRALEPFLVNPPAMSRRN